MAIDEINFHWRKRPFVPFRLHVSDGHGYDVLHPEMMYLTKTRLNIAFYDQDQDPRRDVASRDVSISPLHVTSIEELPERSTTEGEAA